MEKQCARQTDKSFENNVTLLRKPPHPSEKKIKKSQQSSFGFYNLSERYLPTHGTGMFIHNNDFAVVRSTDKTDVVARPVIYKSRVRTSLLFSCCAIAGLSISSKPCGAYEWLKSELALSVRVRLIQTTRTSSNTFRVAVSEQNDDKKRITRVASTGQEIFDVAFLEKRP